MTCDHLTIRLRDGARVNVKSVFPFSKKKQKEEFYWYINTLWRLLFYIYSISIYQLI